MTGLPEVVVEIPSEGSQLSRIRAIVGEFASEHGFDESQIYHIKVAISEAVANAIEHGSDPTLPPEDSRNKVVVKLEDEGDAVAVYVSDQGKFKSKLPTFQPGAGYRGRGLFLMSALMDQVDIDESDTGTTLRLVKKKAASEGSDWAGIG